MHSASGCHLACSGLGPATGASTSYTQDQAPSFHSHPCLFWIRPSHLLHSGSSPAVETPDSCTQEWAPMPFPHPCSLWIGLRHCTWKIRPCCLTPVACAQDWALLFGLQPLAVKVRPYCFFPTPVCSGSDQTIPRAQDQALLLAPNSTRAGSNSASHPLPCLAGQDRALLP